jgi:hypothetical protein
MHIPALASMGHRDCDAEAQLQVAMHWVLGFDCDPDGNSGEGAMYWMFIGVFTGSRSRG